MAKMDMMKNTTKITRSTNILSIKKIVHHRNFFRKPGLALNHDKDSDPDPNLDPSGIQQ